MNVYSVLADLVVGVHLIYMGYVVFGQLAIMIGWPLQWRWIRNPWFRVSHLLAIVIVAVEAVIDFECPLTTLDNKLRILAGQTNVKDISFTGRLMSDIMYAGENWEDHVNLIFYVVAAVVLATLFLVPPRFRKSQPLAA